MGRADYYAEGEWNVTCAVCGRKRKSSAVAKNWQGFWVCNPDHLIPRQPQDFVAAVPDDPSAPFTQPPGEDTFVAVCFPNGMTAISSFGVSECMISEYISPAFDPLATE